MKAVRVTRPDGPGAVRVEEVPDATLDDPAADVLVEVHAIGVSFPDLLLSKGEYHVCPQLPFTLGIDVAGVVREARAGCGFEPGDRVAAVLSHGAGSELLAVSAHNVFPLPDSLSFAEGAAMPMNYLTAHFTLVERAALRRGDTVLIHGASGGVGTACIQVARGLGARTLGVVSSPEKGDFARAAGVDEVVPVAGFRERTRKLTGGRGVDVVVDVVGGDLVTDSLRCLAEQGRLMVVGFTQGQIPTVRFNRLLLNNIDVRGAGWGPFALDRPGFKRAQWDALLPMMQDGTIRPPVSRTYDLTDFRSALKEMESRRTLGKSVVVCR
jgi:NADPH:quinone reductase